MKKIVAFIFVTIVIPVLLSEKAGASSFSSTSYQPNGKEQFVFGEIPDALQRFGYSDLCRTRPSRLFAAECATHKFPYEKYVGLKGYYTDRSPIEDYSGYVAREAVLENGEVIYLLTSNKYKHVGNYVLTLEEHNKVTNFKPEPIIDGAAVLITGYSKFSDGSLNVSSQNGHSYTEQEIAAIRKIATRYPKYQTEIAEMLTTLKVKYDDFNGNVTVSEMPYNNPDSYLSIRIVFKESGEVTPLFVTHYRSKNWLFVKGFSVLADNFRWSSKELDFNRDHSGGSIWEWNIQPLTLEHTDMLLRVSNAKVAKIRYHGKQYFDDFQLTQKQQSELKKLVRIVQLIK